MLAPVSVSALAPALVRVPVPLMAWAKVRLSERSKISAPLLTTGPPITPAVPPAPTCNVPALMVVVPVKVFAPVRVSLSAPSLVNPNPLPPSEITPDIVRSEEFAQAAMALLPVKVTLPVKLTAPGATQALACRRPNWVASDQRQPSPSPSSMGLPNVPPRSTYSSPPEVIRTKGRLALSSACVPTESAAWLSSMTAEDDRVLAPVSLNNPAPLAPLLRNSSVPSPDTACATENAEESVRK